MMCDMILKNGRVIDPANEIDAIADVAVHNGKIEAVGPGLSGCGREINVEGLLVTPGLVDAHCHCYPFFPPAEDSLPTIHPDAHFFQHGVTTVVDAGTCGWRDFPFFKEQIIDRSRVRIFAMLNIAASGMVHLDCEQDRKQFHPGVVAELAKAYPETVVAIKTAHYWVGLPYDAEHQPWTSVDCAVDAAERCGLPCMADFQPNGPERTYPDLILKHLRPGDIHTHMYAQQFPVLDENGQVNEFLFQARERGVKFDLGHGAGSFWFRNAVPALQQGFVPDTLSTDLYLDNVSGAAIGLDHILSKYLSMGMPLEQVIRKSTTAPAQMLALAGVGTLSPGACADIALFRLEHGRFRYADSGNAALSGDARLSCAGTIRAGEWVYNPGAFGMPEWSEAPHEYWVAPGIIK